MADAANTAPTARTPVALGLRENWQQFALLVLISAFVGGMVGLERTLVPLIGSETFQLASTVAVTSFIISFGVVKAITNLVSGQLADTWGRKKTLVLGWAFGLIAVSGVRWLRAIAWAYVQFIRGTPLLVQIFLIYFGLPVLGVNIPAYWSGVIALGLNSGGFQAEIVRAGIESIDRGQTEAARSIGMSSLQTLLFILVPQTVRRVIPPLTNELITLTKSSSLLSAIAALELTHAGQLIIARTFAPFEIYAAVAVLYLILIAVLSRGSALLERRVFVNY